MSTIRGRKLKTQLFISTVGPTIQLQPSWKWSFSKTLFKLEEFKPKELKPENTYRQRCGHEFPWNTNPKCLVIVAFKFFPSSVDGALKNLKFMKLN